MNAYQKRCLKYTTDWVNGVVKHNNIDNECLPDFSCCEPNLFEQDRAKRVASLNRLKADYALQNHYDS